MAGTAYASGGMCTCHMHMLQVIYFNHHVNRLSITSHTIHKDIIRTGSTTKHNHTRYNTELLE